MDLQFSEQYRGGRVAFTLFWLLPDPKAESRVNKRENRA